MKNLVTRKIPTRANPDSNELKPKDKDCIFYYVITGCQKETAYRLFIEPVMALTDLQLKKIAKVYFEDPVIDDYVKRYRETLEDFLNNDDKEESEDISEGAQKKALVKLKKIAIKKLQNIDTSENPDLDLKIADKAGLLDKEVVIEAPRRYLPQHCSNCPYRIAVEENADAINECNFCRYKKYANERGVEFEPKDQLDIPENFNF